jgi:hypothetical protein
MEIYFLPGKTRSLADLTPIDLEVLEMACEALVARKRGRALHVREMAADIGLQLHAELLRIKGILAEGGE